MHLPPSLLALLPLPAAPVAPPGRHLFLMLGAAVGLGDAADSHRRSRQELIDGFHIALGDDYTPTLEELQAFGAIGTLESSYGRGWSGPMSGSNNWGAITCGSKPDDSGQCPAGCSPNKDTSPYSGEYVTCFRRYGSPAEGAAGLISFIYKWPEVQEAIKSGNLDEVSWTMRQRSYFLGFKTDPREAARDHAAAIEKHAAAIAEANGEPVKAWRKGEDWTPGDDAETPGGGGDVLGGVVSDGTLETAAIFGGALLLLWKTGVLGRMATMARRWV